MSETKFTPGPWHWVFPDNDEPWNFSIDHQRAAPSLRTVEERGEDKTVERDGKRYTSFRLPAFILTIEEIREGWSRGNPDDAEAIANMRLIAAAPALYKALGALLARVEAEEFGNKEADDAAIDAARRALSLARGESTDAS